jgi:hypothetical protein
MPITVPSTYPSQFDSYTNLPLFEDGITELLSTVENTQIDALLKIQHAIGLNPQGSKISLVERLNVAINPDGSLKSIPIELLTAQPAQDRNYSLTGGGIVTWSVGTAQLSWTSNLIVQFPVNGNSPTLVAPQTVLLPAPGYVLAVEVSRTGVPQLKSAIVTTLANPLLNSNDAIVLAVRDYDNKIYWRNGAIYEDGDSLPFENIDAARIFFNKIPTTLVSDNVQSALDELDGKVNANQNTSTATIVAKEVESINRDDALQAQIDDIFNDEDRSLHMLGGGNFFFNSVTGALAFTQDIRIYQTTIFGDAIIKQISVSPIVLPTIRSIAYINLDRAALMDYDVTSASVVTANFLPSASNIFAFAIRISTNAVRLFNGTVIFDDSVTTPYAEGETSASHVKFDNTSAALSGPPATVQEALDILDSRLDLLDSTVSAAHVIPVDGIIFMLGSTCPPGYVDVPELNNKFVRGGTTGSLTAVGSDTHVHTGSTGTAGAHTHGAGSLVFSTSVWNQHLSGGGFETDSFAPGTGSGGDLTSSPVSFPITGTTASGGDHSHSFTTGSATHVPAHVVLKACKAV